VDIFVDPPHHADTQIKARPVVSSAESFALRPVTRDSTQQKERSGDSGTGRVRRIGFSFLADSFSGSSDPFSAPLDLVTGLDLSAE